MKAKYDYDFKLCLIGDSSVGKSFLLLRFKVPDTPPSTVGSITAGIEVQFKQILVGDKQVRLSIWDTAGTEKYRSITQNYYRGVHGVIIVYDISERRSFDHVEDWLQEVSKHSKEGVIKMLIGNKCDRIPQRVVSTDEGIQLAQKHGMKFIETSSKDGTNVEKAFFLMAEQLIQFQQEQDRSRQIVGQQRSLIELKESETKQTKCC
eukprot:c20169_g1_i1.p1 GENE.c20169_g1_i1~~c20169_g1_i1.p1  ORF type:complete len:206 (-),score=56.00 c20169_g1_i1:141-758(-)